LVWGLKPYRDKTHFCEKHLDIAYGEYFVLLTENFWTIKSERKRWAGHDNRGRGKVAYRAFGEGT
jgi:hypothetical protein